MSLIIGDNSRKKFDLTVGEWISRYRLTQPPVILTPNPPVSYLARRKTTVVIHCLTDRVENILKRRLRIPL